MKNKQKMNGLYKTAFILIMACIPLFALAIIVAYALEQTYLSVIFSGGGALLALLGIIFATVSKPKKEKAIILENAEDNTDDIKVEENSNNC